jgi:hypothetical protein
MGSHRAREAGAVNMNAARLRLFGMLLPIALDCLANLLVGSHTIMRTLSSTAWKVREHRYFWWTHVVIDAIFGRGHCQAQALAEDHYGSVWAAWSASWGAA